jgi:cellulose synthase/poly-beta-1,6-N-acetylglucosamine synthase-like glycosyltransferase
LVLLPASVFFLEVVLGLAIRRSPLTHQGERRRLTVLVPAHNEATIIPRTIRSIAPQLGSIDRLVVIADNCTDETADVARREGAEVIVRTDSRRRGKGFALDYGVRHLENSAPDIVIIIDADCLVAPDAIDRIARLCAKTNRPVQALYLMRTSGGARLKMRIGEFAWLVKNLARPDGLSRLRLPCQLAGTGMAFPWSAISTANLATGHIVEDLKLGVDLARTGFPPLFCYDALVTSEFPTSESGAEGQRTRWEHGHLTVILQEAPRLFLDSIKRCDVRLLAMACDLSIPPLALLVLQIAILWILSVLALLTMHLRFPFLVSSAAATLILSATLLAWGRYGRNIIFLRELAFAVIYAIWKLPLYVKFLWGRQLEWVRSKRDGEQP